VGGVINTCSRTNLICCSDYCGEWAEGVGVFGPGR